MIPTGGRPAWRLTGVSMALSSVSRIEGTETFIPEDRIKVQSSGVRLTSTSDSPQGEGEGGKEALTARKRRHGPGLSCEGIEDLQIEALLLARVMDALTAVERIPAPADFFQPQVGCDQYIIEDGLQHIGGKGSDSGCCCRGRFPQGARPGHRLLTGRRFLFPGT